ncbi:MAG: hypothetical protein RBG13Loki_0779 [Promethearchaeota archaeon CR_4]|nr:MAG: hypothetical protein RBG13Loki_0779 [Candidatus Lokiarchaeota archaeon CR_4]
MLMSSIIQTKFYRSEKPTSHRHITKLEGIHFADFSPDGNRLVDRHVQLAMQFLPFLSREFIKNIIVTSFIQWQRITGLKVEKIFQTANMEDLRSRLEEIWELFKRNIEMFLLNAEDIKALELLKQKFSEKFCHLQDLSGNK